MKNQQLLSDGETVMFSKVPTDDSVVRGVRIPTHRPPIHPGVLFREEFLLPLRWQVAETAGYLGVSSAWMTDFLNGREPLTPELAVRLSRLTGPSPAFWMNFQRRWEGYGAMREL